MTGEHKVKPQVNLSRLSQGKVAKDYDVLSFLKRIFWHREVWQFLTQFDQIIARASLFVYPERFVVVQKYKKS